MNEKYTRLYTKCIMSDEVNSKVLAARYEKQIIEKEE